MFTSKATRQEYFELSFAYCSFSTICMRRQMKPITKKLLVSESEALFKLR